LGDWLLGVSGGYQGDELEALTEPNSEMKPFLRRTALQDAEKLGAGEILLTSMDCDGQKSGYDLELTKAVSEAVGIPVIASGGAGEKKHFLDALTVGGADAALAASLFHFKELEIADLKNYLRENGLSVRI